MTHKEKDDKTRTPLCGNCKYFVIGGLCELVKGQINSKAICDLHKFGDSHPIDSKVNPTHTKTQTNYKPGFFVETIPETITEEIPQESKAQQMYYSLIQRGVSPKEAHRATIQYYSNPEPPYAIPWPGDVTGVDLAGNINNMLVLDSGTPLTNFNGLPQNTEPYPTSNVSPYGIGSTSRPYPSFYSPSENFGPVSDSFSITNPTIPSSLNWIGTASDVNSQPSMHGEHGYNTSVSIPPWRYDIEQSQMYPPNGQGIAIAPSGIMAEAVKKKDNTKKKLLDQIGKWALLLGGVVGMDTIIKNYLDSETDKPLEIIAEYNYHGHDSDDECAKFAGKRFNLLETHSRPVIPSEKLGYTTQHPNCKCDWIIKQNSKLFTNKLTKKQQDNIDGIETHITDAASKGNLHKVDSEGKLSKKTTKKNPLKELCSCMNVTIPLVSLELPDVTIPHKKTLQEAIHNLRNEFVWLTDDYLKNAKRLAEDAGGVLYLIRAAGETLTDHTGEGEPYRRKLSSDELNSMTRTIIGKSMDINHQPEFEIDATIIDAEFDKDRKEIQTLVIVKDDTINDAIDDKIITAVSINGGMPRSESVENCDHNCTGNSCELCLVPKGVVLGELDGIGMTFVVTNSNGLYWNGHHVSSAEPGIKFTKIQVI